MRMSESLHLIMKVFLSSIVLLLSISTVQASYAPYIAPQWAKIDDRACVNVKDDISVESCIKDVFKGNFKVAVAVAKAETGGSLPVHEIGYNCYYYQGIATTTPIKGGSQSCKVADRHLSWSRDCGIFQVNDYYHKGACEMTVEENVKYAYSMYQKGGWTQWAAYNNGSYLQYLD
jgi:hypothetical protein